MFWNIMNAVHNLPSFEQKDTKQWWTPEEEQAKQLLDHQLIYHRSYDSPADSNTLVGELGVECGSDDWWQYSNIGPIIVRERGQWVLGLDPKWIDYIERHLQTGKYIGTVTFDGIDDDTVEVFLCYNETCVTKHIDRDNIDELKELAGEDIEEEEGHSSDIQDLLSWAEDEDLYRFGVMNDMNGFGLAVTGTIEEVLADKKNCPECQKEIHTFCYDESDVETIWVFEKASIVFAHYGRGAGISFRFHTNISDAKDLSPEEMIGYFEYLKDEQ